MLFFLPFIRLWTLFSFWLLWHDPSLVNSSVISTTQFLLICIKLQVHLIPVYSVQQPVVHPLSADVQVFCSGKESLFVTLESFKERGDDLTAAITPSATIQPRKKPKKQQISIATLWLTPPTQRSQNTQITRLAFVFVDMQSWTNW